MSAQSFEAVEFDPFAQDVLERVLPTSSAQREVWLADKLSREASLAFNESAQLRLRGPLRAAELQQALDALVARHASLRATIGPDGTELLVGAPAGLALNHVDLSDLDADTRQASLAQAAALAVEEPFDLERGPMLRATLYRLGATDHVLLLTAHHVVCDGWSWGVMTEDLGALYAEALGEAPGPDAAADYGDYVAWEATEAASPQMAEHERFWLSRFSGGSLPVLDLPTDRQRAAVRSFNSRRIDRTIDVALVSEVRRLGARAGASVFATLFSAFAALLNRLTGQDDVVVGVPSAGQSASGLTSLVGHCVNLLPVRSAVDPKQPFDALVATCGGTLLDAFEHQTLTYGSLLAKLPVQRDPSRLPLVSVMFNVDQAVHSRSQAFPELDVEFSVNPRRYENFELFINASQIDGALRLECQYNTDLFDAATIERWLGAYEALLRRAVAAPATPVGELDLLDTGARAALLALQPAATPFAREALMHTAFVQQASRTPQRIAVTSGDRHLSYLELDQRSNRLAQALRQRGVRRGDRVGLCLTRGVDMVTALLAVLKAGAAYVPLDPGFPPARLAYYAEDAALALLVTESTIEVAPRQWRADSAARLLLLDRDLGWLDQSPQPLSPSDADAQPQDVAYVIYTSGSTGKPKGVCVPHRAVVNFLQSMAKEPGLGADDVLAAVTTLSFDIAVLELMLPLTLGAQVLIVSRDTAMDGELLRGLLESAGATCMQATPGMWRLLLDTRWQGGARFKSLVGGEALPPDLAQALLARTGELWNMYGPTETTVWSTVWKVEPTVLASRGISVGRPIDNTTVWIIDEHRHLCPVGVPGELCIGGDGVTLGYLDRPDLTADRFIADPFSDRTGALLYRTGDRGRWRNDGLLEHLGRLDFQVKVRGYRIELGEIEAACNEVDGIAQSVVITREDQPGDVRLVAYLTVRPSAAFDEAVLRQHLRGKLPEYMLPQHVVTLPAIPLLPNGKVDRKALPAPDLSHAPSQAERVAPRNPLETAVVAAMEVVLNLPGLGVHDDFFVLGGHSLLAARLTSRLNRDLELNLPLRTLFESPTAERLALAIDRVRLSNLPKRKPIQADQSRVTAPLTVMQDRIRFLEEMQPGRVLYNTPSAHRLVGDMDVAKFQQALRELVARQASLRTSIASGPDGIGHVQCIAPTMEFDFPYVDLTGLPEAEREAEVMRRMQAIIDTSLDIHTGPLFRAALYRLAADQHAFLFMPHHIIWDGWSFDLLYEEMSAIYTALVEGRPNPLPALPVSYADYAQWYADWQQGPEFDGQLRYWKERFARAPVVKAPKPDHPRGAGMSGEGAAEWIRIDKSLTERLREQARGADATLNMLTMAVYTAMMASVVDGDNIVIGVPVRGRLMAEVESIMGFFNNMLPVHLRVPRELSFSDFVRAIKSELLEVFSYQDVPFERLAAEPEVAARTQGVGIYQGLFSFQDARDRKRQWGSLRQQTILIFQKGATEDLGLWLMEVPNGLEGGFIYNADIYDADTAVAFKERYLGMLRRVVEEPDLKLGDLVRSDDSPAALRLARLKPDAVDESTRPALRGRDRALSDLASIADNPTQTVLAQIWAELLSIDAQQVDASDNFFDIGGNSLLAMRAVAETSKRLGCEVDPRRYIHETLGQIAAGLDGERRSKLAPHAGLGTIWARLLGLDPAQIDAADNFFDLGGNSLLAMRAVSEAERELGLKIDPRRYLHETLGQLAVPEEPKAATAMEPTPAAPTSREPSAKPAKSGFFSRVLGGRS